VAGVESGARHPLRVLWTRNSAGVLFYLIVCFCFLFFFFISKYICAPCERRQIKERRVYPQKS
jgi:hypothetical protein